ncbi:hypothetical protein FNV43_RR16921 [Rhamnella rubrinervis]|uniref:Origin recognition complex subunit 5 n=1 Tax=Rhamnella rubrinervis TaxID=2594499 RepID=A0A8K0MDZ0_9ROSA|nr:hypothetical protein FNV43_RR16921 [Rhamnella rubrinervis]
MGKEEIPKITRRTTRSSAAVSNNDVDKTKARDSHPPTLNDLLFGGENPISLDDVLSNFPGRRIQIIELLRILGPMNCPMLPLFIYGGTSTGKTSIMLQIFGHLNRPFVYSSCLTCYNPRILFESILNQLLLHRKNAANGYSSAKRCERPSDFVNLLREALTSIISNLQGNSGKLSSKKFEAQANGHMIYLIFDNLELIREWDKSSTMLPFLFNLYDMLKCLSIVLKPFSRITRRVDELSTSFSLLYQKYCEPISDQGIVPNEGMKRRLFSQLQPHIAPFLNEIFKVSSHSSIDVGATKEAKQKARTKESGGSEVLDELDFHMCTSAKYLLISAFLASRNPATLDASLLILLGPSEKSMERKETAEQELLMKGPGTFPLERLLAIFQCITSVADCSVDEEDGNDGLGVQYGDNSLMSDVLLQLSSLCNANFIVKGGSCPLEGSTRYRSTVTEDMALKVARSLKFPLSKYLYRR